MAQSIYTKSNNIYVFPTANRPYHDPAGRLTTEYNLTSILNRLLDTEGFVISKDNTLNGKLTPYTIDGKFEFNIHGYFFHLLNIKDVINDAMKKPDGSNASLTTGYELIAKLHTSGPNTANEDEINYKNQTLQAIQGGDENQTNTSIYKGLVFAIIFKNQNGEMVNIVDNNDKITIGNNDYYLSLLTYYGAEDGNHASDGWYISEDSKIKFKTYSDNSLNYRSISIDDGELI